MKDFKDIFEKWEQENQSFNYKKALIDKDDDCFLSEVSLTTNKRADSSIVSIDLHGFTRYDAIAEIDRFLCKYKKASDIKIRIIHGAGIHSKKQEPVLKKVINDYLKNNPLVRHFRPGRHNEGGYGVTIVFLKGQ